VGAWIATRQFLGDGRVTEIGYRLQRPLTPRRRWLAPRAAWRHQAVESEVDDQVAIVIHVVLDGEQDGRPSLDLLTTPTFHHLQCLLLSQIPPHFFAIRVALAERLKQLLARLEVLRRIAEVLTGHATEEQV